MQSPSDASDRGRCIELLNAVPKWWAKLDEVRVFEDWHEQIDLIIMENKNKNK